jgi:phosphohistidine swiveling domain-containing protein
VPLIMPLKDCRADAAATVGGKALGLGHLMRAGLRVPGGFVVTTDAYLECVPVEMRREIDAIVAGAEGTAAVRSASEHIQRSFTEERLTAAVRDALGEAYGALGSDSPPVAVRSSATTEDREDASFAGQQETYLWITGAEAVQTHVVRCWASLFTPQAIGYRRRFSISTEDMAMAVVVQRMVPAAAAGVAMTLDPVTGDRGTVYVEAGFGLGEGVVKGDTGSDSFWVPRADEQPIRREIRDKTHAYRFDGGTVERTPVPAEEQAQPAISEAEARAIAVQGVAMEEALGGAQDLEWALDAERELFFVQARPETVWSRRESSPEADDDWRADPDERNVLHGTGDLSALWTVTNIQEAIPGVATPMTWSFFGPGAEYALRNQFRSIGALSGDEAQPPADMHDWMLGVFFGRVAMRVDLLAQWADRVPGMDGEALVGQFFSSVPGSIQSARTRRRYPHAIVRMPVPFLVVPRLMRANRKRVHDFWTASVAQLPTADRAAALRLVEEGYRHFAYSLGLQVRLSMGAFTTVNRHMGALAAKQSSVSAHELVSGYGGHEESESINDMWDLSRNRITLQTFLSRHGYHGWQEGELSNRSWREDPSMVLSQVEAYRNRPEDADPRRGERARVEKRERLEREFLAGLDPRDRLKGRVLIRAAQVYLPMRGVSKAAFLQALDVGRSAVRRTGALLAQDGLLTEADDAFYLTRDELASVPDDVKALVLERRAIRERYSRIDVPDAWKGMPEQIDLRRREAVEVVEGTAASPGAVQGRARVVINAADADMQEGEILIARDTDPAWASLMFLSSALVADIGGVMSHTAVVARELGIPCVVNTKLATRAINTGDLVRVDGSAGSVEVLERVEAPQERTTA